MNQGNRKCTQICVCKMKVQKYKYEGIIQSDKWDQLNVDNNNVIEERCKGE